MPETAYSVTIRVVLLAREGKTLPVTTSAASISD